MKDGMCSSYAQGTVLHVVLTPSVRSRDHSLELKIYTDSLTSISPCFKQNKAEFIELK